MHTRMYPVAEQYEWKTYDPHETFNNVVFAGCDDSGNDLHVGRAAYGRNWLPANVDLQRRVAYVSHGGQEYPIKKFELLLAKCKWDSCHALYSACRLSSGVPIGAIQTGRTEGGNALYTGRCQIEGRYIPGKVQDGALYIQINGREHNLSTYEILVLDCYIC